jgi:hypothetical protein
MASTRPEMRGFWRAIGQIVFWAYERGSWPYDIMVAAILLFVLATPRHWFHDQPVVASPPLAAFQRIPQDSDAAIYTYRVNAALLTPSERASSYSPRLEEQIHEFLSRSMPELRTRTFQVERIQPVTDSSGALQAYDVRVRIVTMP